MMIISNPLGGPGPTGHIFFWPIPSWNFLDHPRAKLSWALTFSSRCPQWCWRWLRCSEWEELVIPKNKHTLLRPRKSWIFLAFSSAFGEAYSWRSTEMGLRGVSQVMGDPQVTMVVSMLSPMTWIMWGPRILETSMWFCDCLVFGWLSARAVLPRPESGGGWAMTKSYRCPWRSLLNGSISFGLLMWVKQCHKPPMTGNGLYK